MSPSCSRRVPVRRAFTLVELLVVIAIIGILVALLLPAVQAAREAARRNQCASQMKQFGLALQTHHDQRRTLPAGRTQTRQFGVSWAFQLLPFIEETAVHDAFVQGERVDDELNAVAMRTPVDLFVCPSRRSPAADRDFDNDDDPPTPETRAVAPAGDYAAAAGTRLLVGLDENAPGDARPVARNVDLAEAGPMFTYSRINLRRVTDGTSHSLAVGEKHLPPTPFDSTPGPLGAEYEHYWQGDTAFFAGDNPTTILRVGSRPLLQDGLRSTDGLSAARESFGGPHPGVTQFVYLDGHVEATSNDTPVETLERLTAIGDGEVIED